MNRRNGARDGTTGAALVVLNRLMVAFCAPLLMAATVTAILPGTASADSLAPTVVPSPSPGNQGNIFSRVSCDSPGDCMAVGYVQNSTASSSSSVYASLAEHWDGSTWSVTPSPDPTVLYTQLDDVSCTSPTMCMAVGDDASGSSGAFVVPLTELWNGTSWSVLGSLGVAGYLNGVSCTSSTSCVAVGFQYQPTGTSFQTLTAVWDGSSWNVTTSPNASNAPDAENELQSVSCAGASQCVAVGYVATDTSLVSLVESWDGSVWTVVPNPNPGSVEDLLLGVSCPDTTNCTAVGVSSSSAAEDTLIESWDGSTWTVAPSPSPDSTDGLWSVSCVTASDCVTVGAGTDADDNSDALTEAWDGSSWTVSPSPSPLVGFLQGISCTAGATCTAVGQYEDPASQTSQTLAVEEAASDPPAATPEAPNVLMLGVAGIAVLGTGSAVITRRRRIRTMA